MDASTRSGPPQTEGWQEYIERVISPGAADRDRTGSPIPREFLKEAALAGILGAPLPEQVGGGDMDVRMWGLALERIGYWSDDASFSLLVSLFAGVARTILRSGREDLIERYVRPFARGERLAAFAFTENADPFAFSSTVRRDGEALILSGEKRMVTGGHQADAFVVYARDEVTSDLDVVIVERDDPGVLVEPIAVMGVRAAGLARLRMEEVRLPAWRLVQNGDGLSHVQQFLNTRRVLLCCAPVGRMERLLEQVIDHVTATVRYRRRVADMHNVQARVGRMKVQLETARQTLYWALASLSEEAMRSTHWTPAIAVAKYAVTESALAMAEAALRVTGGWGYTAAGRFERDVRDFHGLLAGAGAQDILEVDLGANVISERERRRKVGP